MSTAEVYFEADALLGESPVWDDRLNEFQWVDIKRGEIHRLGHTTRRHTVLELGQSVGAIAPTAAGDSWIAGLRDGVAEIGFDGKIRQSVAIDAARPTHRMNDGKCDSAGRFWTGTLDEDGGLGGDALYCVPPDLTFSRVVSGISLSNGLAWSPDDRTMYRVDSALGVIFRSDFDIEAGSIRDEAELVTIPPSEGEPDGIAVDAEGCVWVALWDGWSVHRYTPTGALDFTIELPVARPTSCAFGGDDLRTLFVTTAHSSFDQAVPIRSEGGAVFAVSVATSGVAPGIHGRRDEAEPLEGNEKLPTRIDKRFG